MDNKKYIVITFSTIIITSLIACVLPLSIKNNYAFIISLVIYIIYSLFGIYINKNIKSKELNHNVKNIPIYYYYYLGLIALYLIVILNKIIYIDTLFLTFIYLIIGLVLFYLLFSLYLSVNKLIQREEQIKDKTNHYTEWLSELELLLKEESDENKKHINKVYELIKYSDSISNEATKEIDEKISTSIDQLCKNRNYKLLVDIEKLINKRILIIKNSK